MIFGNTLDATIQISSGITLPESVSKETLEKYLVNDWNVPVLDLFTSEKLALFIKEGAQEYQGINIFLDATINKNLLTYKMLYLTKDLNQNYPVSPKGLQQLQVALIRIGRTILGTIHVN